MPDKAEDVVRERGHALEAALAQNTALKHVAACFAAS
jgi:hypothetical protein